MKIVRFQLLTQKKFSRYFEEIAQVFHKKSII